MYVHTIAGSHGNRIFSYVRSCQTVCQSVGTTLHAHLQGKSSFLCTLARFRVVTLHVSSSDRCSKAQLTVVLIRISVTTKNVDILCWC